MTMLPVGAEDVMTAACVPATPSKYTFTKPPLLTAAMCTQVFKGGTLAEYAPLLKFTLLEDPE